MAASGLNMQAQSEQQRAEELQCGSVLVGMQEVEGKQVSLKKAL